MYETNVLLSSTDAKPEDVTSIIGSVQWFELLARSKLAVYRNVYDFERFPDARIARALPPEVRNELQISVALSLIWSANLDRPLLPMVSATDASTSYRVGVSVAPASPAMVRELSTFSENVANTWF